jgi:hypothetical protein
MTTDRADGAHIDDEEALAEQLDRLVAAISGRGAGSDVRADDQPEE